MILKKFYTAAFAVLAAAAILSCKKDEEDTVSLPYLTGTPRFSADRYVEAGSSHTFTADAATNPTGAAVTYKWTVTRGGKTVVDEETPEENGGRTFGYAFEGAEVKDTLCTFRVTCSASASGYSATSFSADITTVSEKSLTFEGDSGLLPGIVAGTVTDPRDSRTYRTVISDGLEWTAENIGYSGGGTPAGEALEKSDAVSGLFGRFYKWDEASYICEGLGEGWRLPEVSDWNVLGEKFSGEDSGQDGSGYFWDGVNGKLMTNAYFNNDEMWEYWPAVQITNESGFSVLPTGYATVLEKEFSGSTDDIWTFAGFNQYAGFWTATGYAEGENPGDGDGSASTKAYYVYMYEDNPDLRVNYVDKAGFALPVRCVRNL